MADIGKILILPRGVYSSSDTYNILDVVRYNGKVWCCKDNNVSGVAPSESAYWTLWVEDGSSGSGTGDMTKSVYDTDNDGIVDSAETLDGLTSTIGQLNYLNTTTGNVQSQINDRIVDPVTKSNGQVLTWDATNSVWKAQTPSSGSSSLSGLTDVTISSASSGQVLTYSGSAWVNQSLPTVDQTYNSSSTNAQSGTAVASAVSTGVSTKLTGSVFGTATSSDGTSVTFSGIDPTKGYSLEADLGTSWNAPCPAFSNVQITSSGGVYSVTYTLSGANANQSFRLIEIG